MAIVTVYNRGKAGVYGTLNTDDYVFNNFAKGAGMAFFNKDIYPYVKIDNEYFLNDGEPWDWNDGQNSARLMSNTHTFLTYEEPSISRDVGLTITDLKLSPNNTTFPEHIPNRQIYWSTIGKYGIDSKMFKIITHKTDEEWRVGDKINNIRGEGYHFSETQHYGGTSSKHAKDFATAGHPPLEVVFENFTQAKNQTWSFEITQNVDGTKTLKVTTTNKLDNTTTTENWLMRGDAIVKLYQRRAGIVKRELGSSYKSFPNHIPVECADSDFSGDPSQTVVGGEGVLEKYPYPYFHTMGRQAGEFGFGLKYVTYSMGTNQTFMGGSNIPYSRGDDSGNGAEIMKNACLDYICECTGQDIYVKEYSELNTKFYVSPTESSFSNGSKYKNAKVTTKDICLGVLMEQYNTAPWYTVRNHMDINTSGWVLIDSAESTNGDCQAEVNGWSAAANSWNQANIWFLTNGTQEGRLNECDRFFPRLRGILRVKNYTQLDFLTDEYKEATEGKLITGSEVKNLPKNDDNEMFMLNTTLLRMFSLTPGIANISGWDLSSNYDWNKKRETMSHRGISVTAFNYLCQTQTQRITVIPWTTNYYSFCYATVGFEREGYEEEYAYCLTIE